MEQKGNFWIYGNMRAISVFAILIYYIDNLCIEADLCNEARCSYTRQLPNV
jgi:hypothetical protein